MKARETFLKILKPLGRKEFLPYHFRLELFGGQRFDIDLSATSTNPKLLMKKIMEDVYKLGRRDGTTVLQDEIKILLGIKIDHED